MTLLGVLTALAVLGGIVLLVVLFAQRSREGLDLSLRGLLRIYLYLASLAGVVVFAAGLAGILSYALAAGFGLDLVYGGPVPQPQPAIAPAPCPPGATCPPTEMIRLPPDDRARRQGEDLVRGVTFLVFGGIFWGAHWAARRNLGRADAGGLDRAYLMLGTAIFGIATIALLPMGIYQALSFAVVPAQQTFYRQGAGDALSGGLAALPLWLAYLWLVLRELRGDRGYYVAGHGPGGPPPEPSPVGARIGPAPSARSASAEAVVPEDS